MYSLTVFSVVVYHRQFLNITLAVEHQFYYYKLHNIEDELEDRVVSNELFFFGGTSDVHVDYWYYLYKNSR